MSKAERQVRRPGEAHATFFELHERYAEHFGLDPEVGRKNMEPVLREQRLTIDDT